MVERFDPQKASIILLGATDWPHQGTLSSKRYGDDNPFWSSVEGIRSYFLNVLKLPEANFKDLFDLEKNNADDLLSEIYTFLRGDCLDKTDLFVYYVGHGVLVGQEFYLAIRSSQDAEFNLSVRKLWRILGKEPKLRCYFMLDACFSGKIVDSAINEGMGHNSALFFCSDPESNLRVERSKGNNIIEVTH